MQFSRPPKRVVSLVPSMTESLFDLGFGESVVGITDFCIHPAEQLHGLPRLGGPKNPRLAEIVALDPDLVIANQEENTRQSVEQLRAAGLAVWLTFPKTVRAVLEVLWTLVDLFQSQAAAARLRTLETALDWVQTAAAANPPVRYFCPIWYAQASRGLPWWMTFNQDTYSHDLLQLLGGKNVFADRNRRYPLEADLGLEPAQEPGERDTRYPRVSLEELRTAAPEMILLPDEPFMFESHHQAAFQELLADTPAVKAGRIYRVNGSLITWHGTRLGNALQILPGLFETGMQIA